MAMQKSPRHFSIVFLVVLTIAVFAQGPESECWGGEFNEELCCGVRWGAVGNPVCWDEEFTYLRCCGLDAFPRRPQDDQAWDQLASIQPVTDAADEFDFIVIGAGSAGSVVAARLAVASGPDSEPWRVLLLEAGPETSQDESPNPDKAPSDSSLWRHPLDTNWTWNSETRSWSYSTGQGLGGTAMVNSMIYTRGSMADYAPFGWSEEEVLSAYKALEAPLSVPGFRAASDAHRFSEELAEETVPQGYPLTLISALPNELPPLFRRLIEAFEGAGVPFRLDPHGNTSMHGVGGMWRSMGCDHPRCHPTRVARPRQALGRPRASTYSTLVAPLLRNGGYRLTVLSGAFVERINFDNATESITGKTGRRLPKATGVVVQLPADGKASRRMHYRASREIILAAGVFASPHLLTVSGIGEPRELERLGVSAVASAPDVGRHLHEHIGVSVVARTSLPCPDGFHQDGIGKTTHLGNIEDFIGQIYAFLNVTDNVPGALGSVDAEVMLLEGCLEDQFSLTFTLILLQARTRGRLVVQSRNPSTPLHLDYKPLSDSQDIELLGKLVRTLYTKILSAPVLREFDMAADPPWNVVADFWELAKWIRNNIWHYAHPTGTCRVEQNHMSGVVDSRLKVIGTAGLRVADASVFATTPSGHTDAPSRLVGELASRFVIRDHHEKNESEINLIGGPWVPLHGYHGVRMPLRGLGTNGFEGQRAREAVLRFLRLGGRHIDTALLYNNHHEIGAALRESGLSRADVFLTSKVPPGDMGVAETSAAVERAVAELGTHLDLVLLHWPSNFDDAAPLPACARPPTGSWRTCRIDAWKGLEASHHRGHVRALGVSNFGPRHLNELLNEPNRSLAISVDQVEFHPWWPQVKLRRICRKQRISLTAYGSLGSSLIGGAMLKSPAVMQVAVGQKRSAAQVLLRWALQQGVAVIPSSSSETHMLENLDISNWDLTEEDMALIGNVPREEQARVFLPDPELAP